MKDTYIILVLLILIIIIISVKMTSTYFVLPTIPNRDQRAMKLFATSRRYPTLNLTNSHGPVLRWSNPPLYDYTNASPDLLPGTSYGTITGSLFNSQGIPDFREVLQGGLGDCIFDATVAVIAYKSPSTIQNMFVGGRITGHFVENGIRVSDTIAYSRKLPVLTGTQTGAYDNYFMENNTPILWSHYLLQLIACLINTSDLRFYSYNLSGYPAINNGNLDCFWLMNFFTGQAPLWNDPSQLTPQIYNNFNDPNWICVAYSRPATDTVTGTVTVLNTFRMFTNPTNYIVCSHAFSVMSYDSVQQTVTLRNPWGTFNPAGLAAAPYIDGLQTIPLSQFKAAFNKVYYCNLT
jgi:hypothetical protein